MSAREILGSPGRRPSAVRSVTDGEMGRWFFEVPGVPVPADKVRELTDTAVRRSAGDARDSRVGPQGRLSDEGAVTQPGTPLPRTARPVTHQTRPLAWHWAE